jgi:hypothetical protein
MASAGYFHRALLSHANHLAACGGGCIHEIKHDGFRINGAVTDILIDVSWAVARDGD